MIERARAGIDEAISREQLIPLDREKGLFTSGIHVLDELSVRALSRDIMKQNRVTVHPEKSVPRTAGYSDAVSVLAQDRPSLAIVSGQGGAAGQRERVAELVMMAREQGREVQIIAADRRSQMNLKQDERLSGELITGRRQLLEGMAFTPGSTVIVDQGEKLSLKETLTLLDGAARHNVQVLITDSGQRTGTGSALMAMKDAGVNTYRWQGGEQRPATIISEPDRNVRYARLAGDFAASVKAGEESVAQVSGVREQAILTQAIRSELKTQGVLGLPEVTMTALSPVWLDSRSRYLRDMYRPGMVMEQWNPETRSHDRYVIDRVPSLDEAVNTLKPWWPELFDGDTPRLLACGIRDVLLEDVAQRNIPLSHKKLRRALKAITRSESYLCAMKAGACRYDTEGYVTEHISQEEEAYAAARLDKIRHQNRIKAELQAVLDEK